MGKTMDISHLLHVDLTKVVAVQRYSFIAVHLCLFVLFTLFFSEIQLNHKHFTIINIYRSPTHNNKIYIHQTKFSTTVQDTIVTGDSNLFTLRTVY